MADYDAIVVGAGLSGSTAAYLMAKAGLSVLVVERGDSAGSKNVTGGRLYGHSLEKIIPGFADEAPVERCVVREKIFHLSASIPLKHILGGAAHVYITVFGIFYQ